jgi:hypothetical protein
LVGATEFTKTIRFKTKEASVTRLAFDKARAFGPLRAPEATDVSPVTERTLR